MITEAEVSALVQKEIEACTDSVVRDAITALLVPPQMHNRYWETTADGDPYPCWTIAEDPDSGTAYIYCEDSFANTMLYWAIVGISDSWTGMDSNWFTSLERTFYDSFFAGDLPIWNVIKRGAPEAERIVTASLVSDAAYKIRDQLNEKEGRADDGWWPYHVEPRGHHWW